MGLGGQMHHHIRLMGSKDPVKRVAVANISLFESVERAVGDGCDVVQTGRIGQRIDVDDVMTPGNGKPYHSRSDETGAACNEDLHAASSQVKGLSRSARSGASVSLPLKIALPDNGQSMPIAGSSQRTAPSLSGA